VTSHDEKIFRYHGKCLREDCKAKLRRFEASTLPNHVGDGNFPLMLLAKLEDLQVGTLEITTAPPARGKKKFWEASSIPNGGPSRDFLHELQIAGRSRHRGSAHLSYLRKIGRSRGCCDFRDEFLPTESTSGTLSPPGLTQSWNGPCRPRPPYQAAENDGPTWVDRPEGSS